LLFKSLTIIALLIEGMFYVPVVLPCRARYLLAGNGCTTNAPEFCTPKKWAQIESSAGLPDGLFANQKSKFG
jgi:hypothetical protein